MSNVSPLLDAAAHARSMRGNGPLVQLSRIGSVAASAGTPLQVCCAPNQSVPARVLHDAEEGAHVHALRARHLVDDHREVLRGQAHLHTAQARTYTLLRCVADRDRNRRWALSHRGQCFTERSYRCPVLRRTSVDRRSCHLLQAKARRKGISSYTL